MSYPRTRPSESPDEEVSDEAKRVEDWSGSTEANVVLVEPVEEIVESGEAGISVEEIVSWRSLPLKKLLVYGLLALPFVWAAFALTTELGQLLALWVGLFALIILLPLGMIRLLSD